MHAEPSGDQVLVRCRMFGQGVALAASLDEAATLHHRLQSLGELPTFVTPDTHLAHQLLVSGRAVRLAFDVANYGLVSQHVRSIRHDKDKA